MGTLVGGPGAVALGTIDRAAAVAAIKAELRIASTEEDLVIAALADSATGIAEQFIGAPLIVREMTATLRADRGWQRLPAAPVGAILTVATAAGVPLATGDFAVDIDAEGVGWIRVAAPQGLVRVTFAAGTAAGWAGLAPPVRQGVVLRAAHLFEDRAGANPPPIAVTALWRPFRTLRLMAEARAC